MNTHAINDYLNEHPLLDPYDFRVIYFCVHADYGRRKEGEFWYGAKEIAEHVHMERDKVSRCFRKFLDFGWMTWTGESVGRAKRYRMELEVLEKEAGAWKNARAEARRERKRMRLSALSNAASAGPNAAGTRTNPPKEASEMKPPKNYATEVFPKTEKPSAGSPSSETDHPENDRSLFKGKISPATLSHLGPVEDSGLVPRPRAAQKTAPLPKISAQTFASRAMSPEAEQALRELDAVLDEDLTAYRVATRRGRTSVALNPGGFQESR